MIGQILAASALTFSALTIARRPRSRALVIYDGECGFCALSKRWAERLDPERLLLWKPYQSGAGETFGIAKADAEQRVYVVSGTQKWSGFAAVKTMVLWNPFCHLLLCLAIAATGGKSTVLSLTIATLLFLVSPLFTPLGNVLYRAVARNRHRLTANSTCPVR